MDSGFFSFKSKEFLLFKHIKIMPENSKLPVIVGAFSDRN